MFSAPNYCGEFDNAGAVMNVDRSLLCSFQVNHSFFKNKFHYSNFSDFEAALFATARKENQCARICWDGQRCKQTDGSA